MIHFFANIAGGFARSGNFFRRLALVFVVAYLPSLRVCAAATPGSPAAWGGAVLGPIAPPEVTSGQTVAIAAASGHSLALLSTGAVVAWGSNGSGESNVPEAATHDVVAIAAGYNHSMALTSTGRVIVWGSNSAGQGNVPDSAQSGVIQIAAGDSHCLALRKDGSVVAWGANGSGQSLVPTAALSGIGRIGAGAFHSLAVTTTGSVVAWGNNLFGQIGSANGELPASLMSGVTAVAGGRYHSAFLKSDGSVVGLGGVGYGESNVPTSANSQVIAIACGNNHTLALKADGSVVGWGDSGNGQSTVPASLPASGYEAVAAGEIFSVALLSDPLPVILQNPQPLTVWAGRTATLSAAAFGGTLQWQRNGVDLPGETGTTITLAAAKLTDSGLYTVVSRNAFGSVTSAPPAELTVNWPTAPVVTLSPRDATLHEGMFYGGLITQVTGDDLSFQWTKDGIAVPGQTASSYGLGVAQLGWSGAYALIATNAAGSATSAPPARITVLPAKIPVITVNPATVTISARSSQVVLVAQTEADAVVGYEWLKDGSVILGHSGNGFVFPNSYTTELDLGFPEVGASGGYSIRIYSNAGVFTSAVVQVVVTPYVPAPPVITSAPTGSTATQGDSVRLDVVAAGRGLRYQWIKNDVDLPGKTAASLVLASANLADSGSYRVRVTNDDGSVTSDPPAVLVVNALAPVTIVTPPIGAALTAGDPLRLSVVAAGNPKTYQWKRNGTAIYGATNSIYRLVRSMTRHAGEYTVEVGNGFSTTTSSPAAVVTVAPDPNAPPTGGVVELEPGLDLSNSGGFYYDSRADISVPPEAQKGVAAITSFRSSIGQSNAFTFNTLFYTGYSVRRLALLEDGRVVSWGYAFNSNPFSNGSNRLSSSSWAYVDSAPEDAEGILAVQCDRQDFTLRPNGSISGFAPPDPLDDSVAFVAISSAPILAQQAAGRGPVAVDTHLLALRNSGEVVEMQSGGPVPTLAKSGVRAIAAGPQHSVALREDGSVVVWTVPSGELVPVPSSMNSQVSGITADETGFGALLNDGTLLYKPLAGAVITIPPQLGVVIKSGTPSFAITTDRRAVTWDGTVWNPANVPEWTQGRILQRSGTCLLVADDSLAPAFVGPIPDQTVEEMKPVTFRSRGGAIGAVYQWYRDGVPIPSATNESLTLPHPGPDDAVGYTVTVSNGFGSITSSPAARLSLTPPPGTGKYLALSLTNTAPPVFPKYVERSLPIQYRRGIQQLKIGNLYDGTTYFLTKRYDGSVVGWIQEEFSRPYNFSSSYYSKYNQFLYFGQADVPEAAAHDALDIEVDGPHSFVLRSDGTLFVWGLGGSFNTPPSSLRKISGGRGMFFINADGGVVARNSTVLTQDGVPPEALSGVVVLACQNPQMPYALRSDGKVVALGTAPVPAIARSGVIALAGFDSTSVVAELSDHSLIRWDATGTLIAFDGAPAGGGLFASSGSDFYSRAVFTRSQALQSLASRGAVVPDSWQGNVLELTGAGAYTAYFVALLQTASQSIQFDAIADRSLLDGPLTLSATASSGLPVSFRVVGGPASVDGNRLTFQGAGEVTVSAEQGGDATTMAAVPVTRTFVVQSGMQTIEFAAVPSIFWGTGPVGLSATASSGLPIQFSVVSGPGSIDGNQLTPTGAGVVVVMATQPGNGRYQAASATQAISVSPAPQTIAFTPVGAQTVGGAPVTLSATSSSGLPVVLSIVSGPGTLVGNVLTPTGAGVVVVQGSQAGNGTYQAATATLSVVVNPASQVITFVPPGNVSIGSSPITLVATSSRGLLVSFRVSSGPATSSGNQLTLTGTGLVTVVAEQAGDANTLAAEPVVRSFTVGLASQTITFAPIPAQTFGGAPVALSASSSSGLPVQFSVLSGPATISGSVLTLTGAGVLVVNATQPGDATHSAVSTSQSVVVNPGSQSITFAPLADVPFSTTPIALIATSSSGLPVSLRVLSGPAALSGTQLSLTGVGLVTVSAEQSGNANFAAAASVVRSFTVGLASQTITFAPIPAQTFGGAPVALSASSSSGLPVQFSVVSGPATISGSVLTLTGAGVLVVNATQPGDATHSAVSTSQSVVVNPGSQSITFAPLADVLYGAPPFPLVATASSGLPVSFRVLSGPATWNGTLLSVTGVGAVTVSAEQSGNANFMAASSVVRAFTVNRRSQTITFDRIPTQPFSQTPIPLAAASSTGLGVSFFVLSGPATVNGNALMLTGAGTVVVQAVQLGDALNESASASQSIVVTPAEQQITFALAEAVEYTSTPLTLSASSSSTLPVSLHVVSGPALLAGNQLTLTGSGTVVVTAEQSGNTNYKSAVPVTRSLQVSKARQTLSFNLPASVDRAATPSLTLTTIATASSGLPVQFAVVSGPAALNGAVLNLLTAGTVVVSASQPGDDRYLAVSESRPIIVSGGLAQVVSLERPSDRAYAPGLVIPLTASANSGLPVTLTLNEGPGVLTAAGLSIQGAGSFRITATQAGDSTYSAADPVSVSFVITKASQKLSVADVGSRAFGSDPIPLQGSSSSGLPVSFSVVEGPASIENGALKLTGVGVVKLAADQPGNANYEAAPRVLQTVEVLPGVTVTPAPTGNPGPATLEVFLPSGVTGEVEQCDVLGNWTSIGSVKGGGPGTPATLLVIPPGGQASSRFWRIRVGP